MGQFFTYAGYLGTTIAVGGLLYGIYLWIRGVAPALLRLGYGLSTRKITILAESSEQDSLRNLLVDSGMFREKNIISVTKPNDLGRAEKASIYLLHWASWKDNFEKIINQKKDSDGLVVYAPPEDGPIPDKDVHDITSQRNVSIVNFRGRLLSDILVSMMTTSYAK